MRKYLFTFSPVPPLPPRAFFFADPSPNIFLTYTRTYRRPLPSPELLLRSSPSLPTPSTSYLCRSWRGVCDGQVRVQFQEKHQPGHTPDATPLPGFPRVGYQPVACPSVPVRLLLAWFCLLDLGRFALLEGLRVPTPDTGICLHSGFLFLFLFRARQLGRRVLAS